MSQKPSRFSNSPFHKEGVKPVDLTPPKPKPANSEFVQGIVETGRADWKKAPKAVKTRYYGIYMILFSIPIILLPSYEFYKRLEGKSTKKVRQGEIIQGKEVRKYDEAEKWQEEKNSIMYKIFGKDFFLDGFTSRSLDPERAKDSKNNNNN